MYCSKCGKEIPNNAKFCPYCGNTITSTNFQSTIPGKQASTGEIKDSLQQLAGLVTVAILFIASVMFLVTMCNNFESNMDVFEWVDNINKTVGILIYIMVPSGVIIDFIKMIYRIKAGTLSPIHVLGVGLGMCIAAIALKVAAEIFSDWSFNSDFSIVMYRIWGTYEGLWGWTLLFGIIIVGAWILTAKSDKY